MIRDDAAEALAQAEFFDICDDEQRRMLAFAGDLSHFDADAVLYKAGDTPLGAFVLILSKPRPVTVTAVTDARTLFVPRTAFLKLAQQSPDLAQRAVARIERDLGNYLGALEPLKQKMKPEDS